MNSQVQFPASFVPWVQKQLAQGQTLAQMRQRLVATMGYSSHVAELVLASAGEGLSHLRVPAPGERPDVPRNAQGFAMGEVEPLPGERARVLAEIVAPQVLVFQRFLPREVMAAVCEQLEANATRVDRYIDSDRAAQDWLLPDTGAAQLCLAAAANALQWPRALGAAPGA